MMRQNLLRALRLSPFSRTFTTSIRVMAEGDTGATRSGGARQGDAFSNREKANEDLYVRQQELQKLRNLKSKLAEQQKNLSELDKDIDKMLSEADKGSQK